MRKRRRASRLLFALFPLGYFGKFLLTPHRKIGIFCGRICLPSDILPSSALFQFPCLSRSNHEMICSLWRKRVLRTSSNWTALFASKRSFPCRARFTSSSKVLDQDSAGQLVSGKRTRSARKSKAVKEFSALPERLVLINGTSVEPLPPWDGGLGTPVHVKGKIDGFGEFADCQNRHVAILTSRALLQWWISRLKQAGLAYYS